jgi:predicted nuclease of restriction endonuclease-like (RecB) superfamily
MTKDGEVDVTYPGAPSRHQLPQWYPGLLESVSERISTGQRRAVRAANQEVLATYWGIGRDILDRQQEEGWGTKVIDRLSADLRDRFPGSRGFSARNLKYMRAFAAAWPDWQILQQTVAQLPWRHQVALLDKLQSSDLRLWYATKAVEHGWSRDVLAFQIERALHKRSGKAVTNFVDRLPPADSDLAQQMTRDPYLFDFVGNAGTRVERDLERGLMDHLEKFLLELGQGFAFVGRQVKLTVGGDDLYVDLLFYHLELRCFVAAEFKAVKFDPGFTAQLGTYMAIIDDTLRHPDDKPTIAC